MGLDDKVKNAGQDMKGTVKEKVGRATDDEQMESEGTLDQAKAKMKNAGEHVKDAAHDATDAVRDR